MALGDNFIRNSYYRMPQHIRDKVSPPPKVEPPKVETPEPEHGPTPEEETEQLRQAMQRRAEKQANSRDTQLIKQRLAGSQSTKQYRGMQGDVIAKGQQPEQPKTPAQQHVILPSGNAKRPTYDPKTGIFIG